MTVEHFSVQKRNPYEADVAGYEQVEAIATIAVDPATHNNGFVADLHRAERGRDGRVRFEADVIIVRNTNSGGTLLASVANRGMVTSLPLSAGVAQSSAPDGRIQAGDAWALRRGMSVCWIGWQWDVERRPGVVGIDAPELRNADGTGFHSHARLEFLPLAAQPHRRLADEVGPWIGQFQSLPAAELEERDATLTVRDWFNGPRRTVDRQQWKFAREDGGAPVPSADYVWLEGGFEARKYYEVTYTTSRSPVSGSGLISMRDVIRFLRADMGFERVLGIGSSQSGRWLRQFILDTANTAEDGSRVFDGVFCHIAGGRRGEFNNRSAQPSTMNALGFAHLPPFSAENGLFDRARLAGNAPLTFFVNTATEYWRGDASLVHTDPQRGDTPQGEDWRAYMYAGAHHASGMPDEYAAQLPVQFGPNRVEVLWGTRALMTALDEWVESGRQPPPSDVPLGSDGSGRTREDVLSALAANPRFGEVSWPEPSALLGMPPIDLGPEQTRGVGRYPALVTGPSRPCMVSAVDQDGNEVCGVRFPEVAVPLASWFGWNPERPRSDPEEPGSTFPVEVWNLLGGGIAFAPDEALARYRDRDSYMAEVERCVADLVARRHLLAEDAPHVLRHSSELWEKIAVSPRAT